MKKSFHTIVLSLIWTVGLCQNNPCSAIDTVYDKFDEQRTFYSPFGESVQFSKVIYKDKTVAYFISLTAESYSSKPMTDVAIIVDGGVKLEWPGEDTDIDYSDGKYKHTAFMRLSKDETTTFILRKITDFKIGAYQVIDIDGEPYRQYLKCLMKIK
jgi:hypothetical protein